MDKPLKFMRLLTPVLAGCAVIGAYYAGRYVGAHDQVNIYGGAERLRQSDDSASRLWVAHMATEFFREGKPSEALSVLDGEARLQAQVVVACLNRADCAGSLGSPERQAELRKFAGAYMSSKGASQ